MRHATDLFHSDVAYLNEILWRISRTVESQGLQQQGFTAEAAQALALNANDAALGSSAQAGKLCVHLTLVDKQAELSRVSPVLNSKNDRCAITDELIREFAMLWFANVREVASESPAEAVIRFGVPAQDVLRIQRSSWGYWMNVMDGNADVCIRFVPRAGYKAHAVMLTPKENQNVG